METSTIHRHYSMEGDARREREPPKSIEDFANLNYLRHPRFPRLRSGDQFPIITFLLDAILQQAWSERQLLFPNLGDVNLAETLVVYSDFGGETDSRYRTYSFFIGVLHSSAADAGLLALRTKYGLDTPPREFAYKNLTYGPIQRALPEYLLYLNSTLPGLLITVAVDKQITSLITGSVEKDREAAAELNERLGAKWKPAVAQKAIIVLHCVAYLIGLCSGKNQKVLWYCDEDDILANRVLADCAGTYFGHLLDEYVDHTLARIGYATSFKERPIVAFNDILALSDLAAGSVASYLTAQVNKRDTPRRALPILEWLGLQGVALRKFTLALQQADRGKVQAFGIRMPSYPSSEGMQVIVLPR